VPAYFNAPLPDYLYEAYKSVGGRTGAFTVEDRDLFYKHLTGYDFAAERNNSAVPVHFRNIKHIKNPLLMPPIPIAIGTRRGSKNGGGCFSGEGVYDSKIWAKVEGQRSKDRRHNLSRCIGIIIR